MRITCPECGTQYEIDAGLVPAAGRDVQCSACETVWTQHPETAAPAGGEPPPAAEETGEEATVPRPGADRPRQKIDENTRRILREEARREAQERRRREAAEAADAAAPEPGPDAEPAPHAGPEPEAGNEPESEPEEPAKSPSDPPPQPSPVPVAGLREDRPPTSTSSFREAGPSAASGRVAPARRREEPARPRTDLLPDAAESGATLIRPGARRRSSEPVAPEPQRGGPGGFLSGFTLVLVIALLVVGIYLAAPSLAKRVPAIEDELAAFVGLINDLRLQVDLALQSLARAVSGIGA